MTEEITPPPPIEASFAYGMVFLMQGDCVARLRELPDNSVDSCVCDPPYGLGAKPPNTKEALANWLAGKPYYGDGPGFMENDWDCFVPGPEVWEEVFRVLKPGGHIAVFGGARMFDFMCMAIRLAGFEIRDQLFWTYATGFPKSHDIGQQIEKLQTTGRTSREHRDMGGRSHDRFAGTGEGSWLADTGGQIALTMPDAKLFDGWGTALKPAHEPICIARKPTEKERGKKKLTVALNSLKYGTGGINVDACRIDDEDRYPSNFIHDGSDELLLNFPNDTKARFFFSPKANDDDRAGSTHPTVKPVALMAWLIRLLTPVGGTTLDPFAGSGTTGEAAAREGVFGCVMIERERQFCEDIIQRFDGFEARQEARTDDGSVGPARQPAIEAPPVVEIVVATPAAKKARKKKDPFTDLVAAGQMDLVGDVPQKPRRSDPLGIPSQIYAFLRKTPDF